MDRSNSKYHSIVEHRRELSRHFLRELHDHLFLFGYKYSFHVNKLLGWHSKYCHYNHKGQLQSDHLYRTCTSRPIVIDGSHYLHEGRSLDQSNNKCQPIVGHQRVLDHYRQSNTSCPIAIEHSFVY